MAIIKIETKHVMPIVITVLNFMACHISTSMFKIALDDQLSDLKGLVNPEDLDQPMNDITAQLKDPLSLILRAFEEHIISLYDRLAMVHGIDLIETFSDDTIQELANGVYNSRNFYTYGMKGDNKTNLIVFFYSLPVIVDQLIELILTEEYDPEELKDWIDLLGLYFERFEDSDVPAVRELAALGLSIWDFQDQVLAASR